MAGLFDAGGAFTGAQQAQAALQATFQQTAERGVETQLKQEQLKQIQATASLGRDVATAAAKEGKAGDTAWELNKAASMAASRGDLTRADIYAKEAIALEKSALDNRKETLDIAVKENSAKADDLSQAMVSRDSAIEATKNYLEQHKNPTTPEEKAAQANRMQVLDQLQRESQTDMPWEVSPIRAGMDKRRVALEPEKERIRIEQEATRKAAVEERVRANKEREEETKWRDQQTVALRKEALETHVDNKAAVDAMKITNTLNAEDHKYTTETSKLTDEKRRLISELDKLERLGQATITKSSGGWLGIGTTKTEEDSSAAARIKTELASLGDEKTRLDQQHEKALNRIDPENYPLTKPKETKDVSSSLSSDQLRAAADKAISVPGADVEGIKAHYKKLTGKDYVESDKKTTFK